MADVSVHGVAAGGDGVGRLPDGRAVFVRGAVPGDRVRLRVVEERRRFARAEVVELLEGGPGRVEPVCPHVAEGCGGCGWQHLDVPTQRALRARIVADALVRIGRLDPATVPDLDPGPALPALGYRTVVRAAVDADGRPGLRTRHGHRVVPFAELGCPVAHPLVDEVLRTRRFPGAAEVVVRAGVATGEVLVVVDGVPTTDPARVHEDVAGHRFRISAGSFFQARPDGAAALVAAVRDAGRTDATLVDLYAGVGLFAATVGADAARVVAVESNRSAVADARVNVPRARVVAVDVARWRPRPADAVVADPARAGLGADAVRRIEATGARRLALVSCDPGSLGRDAGLLTAAGFELRAATLVDLFPQTPHVEVVTAWAR